MPIITEDITEIEEDSQKGKYLTFNLGENSYGIEIRHVTEIVGVQPFNSMPELPVYYKGIINLRGRIIPVMDMRLRFDMPPVEYNDRTCIVIIDSEDISAGLIVDCVDEVLSFKDEDIADPPEVGAGKKFIKGIGKHEGNIKLLLDCEKLFSNDN